MRALLSLALTVCCLFAFAAIANDAKAQSLEEVRASAEVNVIIAKATLSLRSGRALKSAGCECESCRCVDCVCESQQRFANDKAMKVVEAAKVNLKTQPTPPVILVAPKATVEPPPISKAGEPRFSADKRTLTYDDGRVFTLRSDGTYWPASVASSSVSAAPTCANGQCPTAR